MKEKLITITKTNIENEHICCAIGDKKSLSGVNVKKNWLTCRIKEGYSFKKFDIRGKVFIEYGDAEKSFSPIEAKDYTLINCFWVSGQYKGKGYGQALLNDCIENSKYKNGIVVITSKPKKPFMNDRDIFIKNGFEIADTALPYFELLVKKNDLKAPDPQFLECAKPGECNNKNGITIYYSDRCVFPDLYIKIIEEYMISKKMIYKIIKFNSNEEARQSPCPSTIYSFFYNGKFVTQEILTVNRLEKLLETIK